MNKKGSDADNISARILGFLWKNDRGSLSEFIKQEKAVSKKSWKFLTDTSRHLERAGRIETVSQQRVGRRVVRKFVLTPKGMMYAARLEMDRIRLQRLVQERRLIVFDIPEEERLYRDYFRELMKDLGCKMVQLSVWQADFELPDDFIRLVKELGLQDKVIIYKVKPEETMYL